MRQTGDNPVSKFNTQPKDNDTHRPAKTIFGQLVLSQLSSNGFLLFVSFSDCVQTLETFEREDSGAVSQKLAPFLQTSQNDPIFGTHSACREIHTFSENHWRDAPTAEFQQ